MLFNAGDIFVELHIDINDPSLGDIVPVPYYQERRDITYGCFSYGSARNGHGAYPMDTECIA